MPLEFNTENTLLTAQFIDQSTGYEESLKIAYQRASTVLSTIQKETNKVYQQVQNFITTTAVTPIVKKSYTISTQVETVFNLGACLPVLGIAFSMLRSIIGKCQVVAGAALMLVGKIGYIIANYGHADAETLMKWKVTSDFGAENVLHGCLNVIRGLGEILLGTLTLGFGSIALLIPNLANSEPFAPIFSYGTFVTRFSKLQEKIFQQEPLPSKTQPIILPSETNPEIAISISKNLESTIDPLA